MSIAPIADFALFDSDFATIGREQEPDSYDHEKGAIDSPLRLPGHEAAGKNVDSLKNPDAAEKQTENTRDNHYDAHNFLSEWLRPGPPAAGRSAQSPRLVVCSFS
jgi:hypothetical protein